MSDHKSEYYLLNAKLCRLIQAHPCMYDRSAPNYMRKEYVERAWDMIAREVNDTVASCKERWRNIRTAYARSVNIYKTPSGPNRHKRYYLHDELQFLTKHLGPGLPSLRILTPNELDENLENFRQSLDQTDENCTLEITLDSSSPPPAILDKLHENEHIAISEFDTEPEPELEPEPEPGPEPEPEQDIEHMPEADRDPEPDNNTQASTTNRVKKRRRNITEDYPNVANKSPKSDADSEFLKSLLPEMKNMNARQKIIFKGKIYQVLEEVFSDSKDFPPKDERFLSQKNLTIPSSSVRGSLSRRIFGHKGFTDRREKLPGDSGQSSRVSMVQLAQSQNENVLIKHETLDIND